MLETCSRLIHTRLIHQNKEGMLPYGMGARIKKKQSASAEVATSNATAASSETSFGEQPGELDSLKEKRHISPSE